MRAVERGVTVDGLDPDVVWDPRSAQEVAEDLAAANSSGKAVIPVGGARALGLGDPPERYDVALRTTALDRVLEHSVHDLTVTVEAGITLESLHAQLSEAGQFLPLDPFASPGHTIGGVLATALTGPLRLRYGSARDYLIGLRVALPDGRLVRSGGKVVKNVSGYDMNKLHHGALGSLGVIVEASFKVFPRPKSAASVQLTCEDLQMAWREAERALELKQRPVALELANHGSQSWTLKARFFGEQVAIGRMTQELGWSDLDDAHWTANAQSAAETWVRIAVDPARLAEVIASLPPRGRCHAEPGVGIADWFDAGEDIATVKAIRELAARSGGSLVVVAGSPEFKRSVGGAWGAAPPTLPLMRALRHAFDPQRTLSPGRFLV